MLAFARKSAGPAVRGLQQARPRGIAVVTSHSQLSNALRPTCLSVSVRHNQQASAESHKFGELDHVRRRLLYRSKQRGWLEMDIMLGNWAAQNLGRLNQEELDQFQHLLDLENPDLYKWLTGQEDVPEDVVNPLLRTLCRDLAAEYEPKVTVASASGFSGKVWE